MKELIRYLPPVCLLIALGRLLTGKLILSKHMCGSEVQIEEGKTYVIFRNIKIKNDSLDAKQVLFAVSFRFARLSHKANKIASLIPMLIIAGYPGFIQKLYAVDHARGYWQGIYLWKSQAQLNAYKRSFVYKIMNKRAAKGTINSCVVKDKNLEDCLQSSSNLKMKY